MADCVNCSHVAYFQVDNSDFYASLKDEHPVLEAVNGTYAETLFDLTLRNVSTMTSTLFTHDTRKKVEILIYDFQAEPFTALSVDDKALFSVHWNTGHDTFIE